MQLLKLLLAAIVASAAAPDSRAVVGINNITPFPQTVPSGTAGVLYTKYKPFLKVVNGCVPFAAVAANGDTSGGLQPTGAPDDDCSSSTGQVYARAATYKSYYAILYSWYWPKDEPIQGIGHRHDWEGIVVWLSSASTSATLVSVATSAHGGWTNKAKPALSGNGPLIEYISYFPLDHQLDFTSVVGGQQPLIAWESLPAAAQAGLSNTDWGDANVPFIDSAFMTNLAAAYPS